MRFWAWLKLPRQVVTGTSSAITGLTANTAYEVQVRATNDEGTGNWSSSGTGTTVRRQQPACVQPHRGHSHGRRDHRPRESAEICPDVDTELEEGAIDPLDESMAQDRSPIVADFFQAARMVALSDMARRKRDGQESLRKNLLAMLESVEAHANALRRFKITPGRVSAVLGDARDLRAAGVKEASVDAVVTSPPYSIALDYVKNDDHALAALGVNVAALRGEMTGVRGRRPKDKLALYNEDMQRMFREVARVLKPGARAAFVIGDATVDRQEHTTTREMGDWAVDAGLKREREIPKSCLASTTFMQDEKILVFSKP